MSNVLDFEPAASGSPPTDIELCSATSERLRDEQYALEDALGDGTSPRKVLAAVAARLADDPDWIEGLTLRGHLRVDDGCIDAARADFRRAYETGVKLLPRRYSGRIEWCYLDNRPFLRAASAYAHVFCRLGRWRDAIPLFRKLLRWNPNDNQGIRYSLGPALLRAGRIRSARAALWRLADENPAMAYELGLLEVGEAEWTAAATALRATACPRTRRRRARRPTRSALHCCAPSRRCAAAPRRCPSGPAARAWSACRRSPWPRRPAPSPHGPWADAPVLGSAGGSSARYG